MRRDHSGVLSFVGYTIASVCIVHAVFFGEDRYHLTVTPLLCLLAATLASRADPASPR